MVERSSTILLIVGFFTLILGVSLLTTIAEAERKISDKTAIVNESFDFTSCRTENEDPTINNTDCNHTVSKAPTGWKLLDADNACPIAGFALRNCTGNALTITTDYLINLDNGVLELKNTSNTGCGIQNLTEPLSNFTYMDYTYCSDDYLTQSWSRTVSDVVVGMFAIALMIISVGIFYSVAQREGIIGI